MLGYVFIAKVYIDSNIEIEIEVVMYYFQSLNGKRKKKKEYGLDFSFKYLQKRNIRKEKHHQNQTQYSLKYHPYPDFGSHRVYSQSSRNAFAGSLRSPSQAIHHASHHPKPHPLANPQCKHHSFGGSLSLDPSVIPKSKDKATLRHHSPLKEKTPPPPPRYTNRRILSPLPPFP